MSNKPLVSAIITTKNEESHIADCIRSVKNQTYKNLEIIVVDNYSTDRTAEIAKAEEVRLFRKGPERSAQRNFGVRQAKGEYLIFLDADMILSDKVIASCVQSVLQDSSVKAVIIPERSVGDGFWSACKALEREYYMGIDWMEAARFYNKESFIAIGGFDENLTGPEDFDLNQRFKSKYGNRSVVRISDVIIHDEGKIRLLDHLRKKYYYGRKMSGYIQKHVNRSDAGKQASLLRRYVLFLSKPSLLKQNPIVGIGMLFLKTAETTALGIGYLLNLYVKPRN